MGRDFPPVQTGSGAHPSSCKMGVGSLPEVNCGRCVLLTTHPLLVPRTWKCRAIPLLLSEPYGLYSAKVQGCTFTLTHDRTYSTQAVLSVPLRQSPPSSWKPLHSTVTCNQVNTRRVWHKPCDTLLISRCFLCRLQPISVDIHTLQQLQTLQLSSQFTSTVSMYSYSDLLQLK